MNEYGHTRDMFEAFLYTRLFLRRHGLYKVRIHQLSPSDMLRKAAFLAGKTRHEK